MPSNEIILESVFYYDQLSYYAGQPKICYPNLVPYSSFQPHLTNLMDLILADRSRNLI